MRGSTAFPGSAGTGGTGGTGRPASADVVSAARLAGLPRESPGGAVRENSSSPAAEPITNRRGPQDLRASLRAVLPRRAAFWSAIAALAACMPGMPHTPPPACVAELA